VATCVSVSTFLLTATLAWSQSVPGSLDVHWNEGAGVIGIKGSPAYTAEHGVIGLTRAAALDYAARNIRINAVCPGYIDTPMIGRFTWDTPEGRAKVIAEEPAGRMGKPEEIAAAVVWLCSDSAAFMVGHAMVIMAAKRCSERRA
jgi:NAD(P)-dependent dehydrogenase (short-subunit alcohol dehydrogenase family)